MPHHLSHPRRLVSLLALTGMLMMAAGNLPLGGAASAMPLAALTKAETTVSREQRLPKEVANRILQDAARRFNVPQKSLRVGRYSRQTWSDGCLGLGGPAEICLQALVAGWQVEVIHPRQRWTYHTDMTARSMRVAERQQSGGMPKTLSDRLLQQVAQQAGVPQSRLTLVAAQPRTWDGCMGIERPGVGCTRIALPGWQAIVSSGERAWVYHVDEIGNRVVLNPTASATRVTPQFLPGDRPGLGENILFRQQRSAGIAGIQEQTVLMADGSMMRLSPQGRPTLMRKLSAQEVQKFTNLLMQQQFSNLNGLGYMPDRGADYFTVTLTGSMGTTQYADMVQDRLPPNLQRVIQMWNEMARVG